MGLDMYLDKRIYIGNNYRDKEKQIKLSIPKESDIISEDEIDSSKISEIILREGYWRKANAIH